MAISAVVAVASTASAFATGALAAGTAIGSTLLGTSLFAAAAGHFLVTTAIGAALNALAPKPSTSQRGVQGYNVTANGSALDHQVVYGQVRTSGARVFDEVNGDDNKLLHRVIAFTGHEIESFENIYINDESVSLDGDGIVVAPSRYAGYAQFKEHLGSNDQTADETMLEEVSGWTEAHRLRGIAYLYTKLEYNQDVYPNGVPEVSVLIRGKKIYDPRTGTVQWSDNPALCLRDYLTNSTYGLGEDPSNVDDSLVVTAANICDQTNTPNGLKRYTCNGHFTTATQPYDVITSLLSSMGGLVWYGQGKWRMKAAAWSNPVMTLDENDLRSSISVNTRHSRSENFNTVRGTFRGEETVWQVTDFPPVTNEAFISTDNGEELSTDIQLGFTDNSEEARRISRVYLERNRQQLTVNASWGLRAFQLQVGDIVRVNNTRFGWASKTFEVVAWTFGLTQDKDLQVEMTLREISPEVFDDVSDGVIFETDNSSLGSPFAVAPVGVSVETETQVTTQKVSVNALVTVNTSSGALVDSIVLQYRKSGTTEWNTHARGPTGSYVVADLDTGFYDFRARAKNVFGVLGSYTEVLNKEVKAFAGPPDDIQNLSANISGPILFLSWDPVAAGDLSHCEVRYTPTMDSWANASVVVPKVARPATSVSVPARPGFYLVRAIDKEGNISSGTASYEITEDQLQSLGTKITHQESPAFNGDKVDCVVSSGKLVTLDPFTTSFKYTFENRIDVMQVRNCRVNLFVNYNKAAWFPPVTWDEIPDNKTFDEWPDTFDEWTELDVNYDDVVVTPVVEVTQDDPFLPGSLWKPYDPDGSFINGRGFRFKISAEAKDFDNYKVEITELRATVEY